MEKFIVSARKYRPATFSTLIGQDSIATTLKNSIKREQLAHAYLFCGPRGVGKTTTARIFAKTINCMNPGPDMEPCGECESCKSFDEGRSYCIHELDAASNNSVDDIRALTEKVMIPPQIGKYSVYIIDEVHMLSTAAFNAFLKTLEEPPAHAIFILATTEKQKIIPTILSRCQVFDFNRISIPDIVKNLKQIAEKEQVTIDDESLHVIAQKADGAMRDALTLFDQVVAFCGNTVKYEDVIKNLNVLDYDYYFKLTDLSLDGDFANSLVLFDEVLRKGFNALYFVDGLGNHLRNLLVCKESASAKLLEVSPALEKKYKEQSQKSSLKFLFNSLAATEKCEGEYNRSGNTRLLVEFMLVRISQITGAKPAEQPAAEKPAEEPVKEIIKESVKEVAAEPAKEVVKEPVKIVVEEPVKEVAAEPAKEIKEGPAKEIVKESVKEIAEEPAKEIVKESVKEVAEEPAKEVVKEPAKIVVEEPVKEPAAGISIASLMAKAKQEDKAAATSPEKSLDFMGPSNNESITIEKVKEAWEKLSTEYTTKYPALVRFAATIKKTVPILEEDNLTIDFPVGNSAQKAWIEKNAGKQMADFLRKTLKNDKVHLSVNIKTQKQIEKQLYTPEEQESHLEKNNPEIAGLKDDLGLQLK